MSHCENASVVDMTQAVKVVGKTEEVAIVYIRDVPDDVHRRMKAAAALLGESMQAAALRALEAEVERMEARVDRERRKRARGNERDGQQ
jgi:plasmid stability protein